MVFPASGILLHIFPHFPTPATPDSERYSGAISSGMAYWHAGVVLWPLMGNRVSSAEVPVTVGKGPYPSMHVGIYLLRILRWLRDEVEEEHAQKLSIKKFVIFSPEKGNKSRNRVSDY